MTRREAYETYPIDFEANDHEIDYFKIPIDSLVADGFKVDFNPIIIESGEYLSLEKHLNKLDHEVRETIVLNIQVGKGKTKICYDLIEYYSKKDFLVIVLSPFRKLVEKDATLLRQRGLNVFHYADDKEPSEREFFIDRDGELFDRTPSPYLNTNIQVMTINCLLQNPGANQFDQSAEKKGYLNALLDMCIKDNRKVVFFFDEIHESIHNFHPQFIPNLFRWSTVVHKCYIASATFTVASLPVIKYLTALTLEKLSIYETPRTKVNDPVSLHLHLVADRYSAGDLSPLNHIRTIISDNKDKKVHILTGYKTLADALVNSKPESINYQISNAVNSLNPNLITGDRDNPFDETRSNVGTAFKTGIDITDNDSVFIIILPCITDSNNEYGIFTDGIPSIIQSMARIRKKGQVHVFMYNPRKYLYSLHGLGILKNGLPQDEQIKKQNTSIAKMHNIYDAKKYEYNIYLEHLSLLQSEVGYKLGYTYPSITTFLMEQSAKLLINEYSFGKELSPFILWAGLNEQFTNAKLNEITLTSKKKNILKIDDGDIFPFIELSVEPIKAKLPAFTLHDGIVSIMELIEKNVNGQGLTIKYKKQSPKSLKQLWNTPSFMQSVINYYIKTVTNGIVTTLNRDQYILSCCLQANSIQQNTGSYKAVSYMRLNNTRNTFLAKLMSYAYTTKKQQYAIDIDVHEKFLDSEIAHYLKELIEVLEHDAILKLDIFSLSRLAILPADQIKKSLVNAFIDMFTNVSSKRVNSSMGVKEGGLIIDGNLEKQVLPELRQVLFL